MNTSMKTIQQRCGGGGGGGEGSATAWGGGGGGGGVVKYVRQKKLSNANKLSSTPQVGQAGK